MELAIKHIFTEYSEEYLRVYAGKVPANHKKVIDAIINCRTEAYGVTFYKCESCGKVHSIYRSCCNRHCPVYENHKTKQWVLKQLQKELNCNYFMITFTVPQEIREFFLRNQKVAYSAFFKASSEAIKTAVGKSRIMKDGAPGFFGVLHTWGRQIQYHPHIHYVAPGGSLNTAPLSWNKTSKEFYLPIFQLSKLCKEKFKRIAEKQNALQSISPEVWDKEWNVNIQAVGSGRNTIKYLSRYVFKVAISDHRILKVQDRRVYFKLKDRETSKVVVTSLDVLDFIKKYLLHVLPSGFMKVRYYGFMHPSFFLDYDELRLIVEGLNSILNKAKIEILESVYLTCSSCGNAMKFMFSILPTGDRIRGLGVP